MHSGCGRSTNLHRDLNIEEQPGLQRRYCLSTDQRTRSDERSNLAVRTIGAYLGAARGLPSLIGTRVTAVVLLILQIAEAIGETLPIERTTETLDVSRARVI